MILWSCVLTSCICLSSPNYWLYIYILEPRAFMHILCGLIMFRICMYALVCIWHTYALKYKLCFYENFDFSWFHVFKEFHMSLIEYFHDWYVSHNTCSLTLLFTHDLFSWDYDMGFMNFECLVPCDLHVFHEKLFCFHFPIWRISF